MNPDQQNNKDTIFRTACDAARGAGAVVKKYYRRDKEVSYKGRIDLVTNVDYESEETIVSLIKSRHPDHDIITEESDIDLKGSEFRWIIDPVDGTVNYAHDLPFACVSIGLKIHDTVEIGVVYNPMTEEFFTARRGAGAFCNDIPLKVSDTGDLEKSFLATGFPYDITERPDNNIAHFNHFIRHAQGIRRLGSAALDLCYCAMGIFDGYWEVTIKPWDIAAGVLMVTEAGGMVTRLDGSPLSVFDDQVLATNGIIHSRMVEHIAMVEKKR